MCALQVEPDRYRQARKCPDEGCLKGELQLSLGGNAWARLSMCPFKGGAVPGAPRSNQMVVDEVSFLMLIKIGSRLSTILCC